MNVSRVLFGTNMLAAGFILLYTKGSFFSVNYFFLILVPQLFAIVSSGLHAKGINDKDESFILLHDRNNHQEIPMKLSVGCYLFSVVIDEQVPLLYSVTIRQGDASEHDLIMSYILINPLDIETSKVELILNVSQQTVSLLIESDCVSVTRVHMLS